MGTYNKQLQTIFHEYEAHIGGPVIPRDAVEWALSKGRLVEPKLDPKLVLVRQMTEALRSEQRVDDDGRRYPANAAVTFTNDGGVQESLWGDVDRTTTSDDFQEEHFGQCRKGIADDCSKLKKKVDHYNARRSGKQPYQLILDFTDDVAEREASEAMNDVEAAE